MLVNQDFQSLLQLAVALNIGFTALVGIFGTALNNESVKVHSLFEAAKSFRNTSMDKKVYEAKDREVFSKISKLKNEIISQELKIDGFIFQLFRFLSITCSVIAFLLLMWASIFSQEKASMPFVVFSVLVNLPFVIGVVLSALYSLSAMGSIRESRKALDNELHSRLDRIFDE